MGWWREGDRGDQYKKKVGAKKEGSGVCTRWPGWLLSQPSPRTGGANLKFSGALLGKGATRGCVPAVSAHEPRRGSYRSERTPKGGEGKMEMKSPGR